MSMVDAILEGQRKLLEQNIPEPYRVRLTKTQMMALAHELNMDLPADPKELADKMDGGAVFGCVIELDPRDTPVRVFYSGE